MRRRAATVAVLLLPLLAACSGSEPPVGTVAPDPAATTALPAADAELLDSLGCLDLCRVTGRIPVEHPTWGPIEIVTLFGQWAEVEVDECPRGLVVAVDPAGEVLWSSGPTDCGMSPFGPAGTAETGSIVDGPVDELGHVFLEWNPGRLNGVSVLVMTDDGIDDLDTLPVPDYLTRFYGSRVVGGRYEAYDIVLDANSYHFGGAGGPHWSTTFEWDGEDYVPRPEWVPVWCGYVDVDLDDGSTTELRDITIMDTTCWEVLSAGGRSLQDDDFVLDAIVQAHDHAGGGSSFEAAGWACEVTNPATEGAAYLCRGDGTVGFTRWSTRILDVFTDHG